MLIVLNKLAFDQISHPITKQYWKHVIRKLLTFRYHPAEFDLVLTDQTMPKMTGEQLTRKLLAIRPDIPIILCTGYSEQLNEGSAKTAGAKSFLIKPLNQHEIAHTVRALLDGKSNEKC